MLSFSISYKMKDRYDEKSDIGINMPEMSEIQKQTRSCNIWLIKFYILISFITSG